MLRFFQISKTRSALIQAVVYGGYFIMAIPAGRIIGRFGYRTGVIVGLLLYGVGALLFIPGSGLMSFGFFLFSLFIIGCGLTCLETAANPYVTILGDADSAERRINLSQAFNGLGWICGPLVGGYFLFAGDGEGDIATPYALVGVVVLLVALVFTRVKLPEVVSTSDEEGMADRSGEVDIWKLGTFRYGLLVLFLYVAAQTGINSFFINFMTESAGISAHEASIWLSFGGMGLFVAGRMGGSWIMSFMRPERLLSLFGLGAALSMAGILLFSSEWGLYCFFLCFFCESIMFPTIFALAIRETGSATKRASSYLIMSIVGGAVAPLVMGVIADNASMTVGFCVPLVCFIGITLYALGYGRLIRRG